MKAIETLLNDTLGCLYLVGVFSVILYGCTCGQVLYYVSRFYIPGDRGHIAALVALLWILDTGKTIADLICGWDVIGLSHGDPFILLDRIPTTLPGDFAASCTTIYIVQCCYLHTIWKFIKNSDRRRHWPIFMLPPVLLATGSFVTGIVAGIQVLAAGSILDALPRSHIAGSFRPACSAAVDIYITVWLCYHLQDSKTGHKQTDYKVTKIVNYAITRGIVTSVVQVVGFALFLVDYRKETLWFMLFYISASTIYVNSLLAMWNARGHVCGEDPTSDLQVNTEVEVPPELEVD